MEEKDPNIVVNSLTDQEKKDILLGMDPKMLQQAVNQKKKGMLKKRAKSEGALHYDSQNAITEGIGEITDLQAGSIETAQIQNHLNTALAVVDNLHPGTLSRSPSLRRISIKPEEPKKRTFMKRKHSEPVTPKLVFTFTNEEDQEVVGTTDDDEDSTLGRKKNYSFPNQTSASLGLDHLLDNSDTISVRSFQNETLNVQRHLDKWKRQA